MTATKPRGKGAPSTNGAPARRTFDLDAARAKREAARAEVNGPPAVLIFGGQEFTLPSELPIDFALYAAEGEMRLALGALLGDQADAFFSHRPSVDDFRAIGEMLDGAYGVTMGDSSASPSS